MYDVPYAVKKALRKGFKRKEYKILVLNDDGTTDFIIDNDTLVSESVNIDERMCSGDRLKFGLCEGSTIEFQYFNHGNIHGRRLQISLRVKYATNTWYSIPMGFFEVDACSLQMSTGIYKATAYNKLQSKYLDAEAKNEVKTLVEAGAFGQTGSITMYMLLERMLNGYHVTPDPVQKIEQTFTLTPVDYTLEEISLFAPTYPYPMVTQKMYWFNLNLSYTFQLNTIDDYYRVTLNLWDMATRTRYSVDTISSLTQYWFMFPGMGVPMKLNEAIELMDEVALDRSYGDFFYGTVKITRADDHTKTLFYNRLQTFTEPGFPEDIVEPNNEDYANCYQIVYSVPVYVVVDTTPPTVTMQQLTNNYNNKYGSVNLGKIYNIILSDADMYTITSSDVENIDNVTLRDLQSAVFEMQCQYGQLNRKTDLFRGVELNQGGLLPRDNLYPANDLYPSGQSHIFPSTYSKLWTDTGGEQSFRYLIITYKTTEIVDGQEQEVEKTLQRTVNANGTTNYNMSDNWLFRNLIWDAEDVGAYADAMVLKMKDITWFPFEMWCAGLPYLETGDALEIVDREGNTHISYILNRQLKGIHNLQDTFINGELDVF